MRLIGLGTSAFLRKHFSRPAAENCCVHGELREGSVVVDDPVVVVSADGAVADLNLHGGPWVVTSVLDLLRRSGFEIIEDTQEALDAFDADTMIEREMLAALPLAKTREAIEVLLAQPAAWERFLASNPSADRVSRVLHDRSLHGLLHPPRVAIVGVPNVGKSTLANQLFAQERAITADVPGTTRDWVGELANLDGLPVMLVDTPGVRETADPLEQAAIARSASQHEQADLVLMVIDPTQPLPPQLALAQRFASKIIVINKVDLAAAPLAGLETIATTGQGVDPLRRAIRAFFDCETLAAEHPRCWTERQRAILQRAMTDTSGLRDIIGS